MSAPKFGVCILSHRMSRAAGDLARRILSDQDPVAVVIVENGEQRADRAYLDSFANEIEDVRVLFCSNRGYAHGNNLGLNYLMSEYGCQWAVVLNPDVSIPQGVKLSLWIQAAGEDGVAVSGPQILDDRGRVTPPLAVLSPWNAVIPSPNTPRVPIHATTGCALAIHLQAFFSCGGFDEELFLYREEQALGHTLERYGLKWGYHPDFTIVHHHQRKVSSYSSWLKHRIWEYQSTVHVFMSHQRRGFVDLWFYRILFGIKSAIYVLFLPFFARR